MDSMFGGLYIMPPACGIQIAVFFPLPPVWQVHDHAGFSGRFQQAQRIQKHRPLLIGGARFAKRMTVGPF